jgi:hypothetical protein
MVTEIKLDKLGKLSKCRRHMAMETELAHIDHCHTSVRMKGHTWLVTPEVRILVEVPVASARMILTDIIPVLSVERFPDLIKGIIILEVFVAFMKLYRYVSLCDLVILNGKGRFRNLIRSLKKPLAVVIYAI